MKIPVKKEWLAALAIIAIATLPTIPSYYFGEPVMYQSHDHVFHLIRLWHIEKAFQEGILMPSWLGSMTFGMGSPVFLFSWFLPYYLGLPLRWAGLTLADTMKALFVLFYFFSGITIYLLARKWTNPIAGLVAIPFYLLSPFRLNLIFTRQGPGEAMAQVLLPLSLLFLVLKGRRGPLGLTLVLSMLSLTHNITYIFVLGILLFWMLFIRREKATVRRGFAAIGLSLLLTAYFWLPALVEREYSHYHETARQWYQDQFPSFRALLSSPWQYGPPQPENQELSMSFQIGKIHWLIVALVPLLWLRWNRFLKAKQRIVIGCLILLVASIFFQLKLSKPVWDNLDPIQIFIFPWRLQAISVFAVSILAAFLVSRISFQKLAVLILLAVLLVANRNHFYSARGDFAADDYIKAMGHDGGSSGEFLPIWANIDEYRSFRNGSLPPPTELVNVQTGLQVGRSIQTETRIELDLDVEKEQEVVLNHYYFPGWQGKLNGQPVTIYGNLDSTNGRMSVHVPPGKHSMLLEFEQTLIRQFASTISALTLILIIFAGIITRRTRKVWT
jgi:hypothetical protein